MSNEVKNECGFQRDELIVEREQARTMTASPASSGEVRAEHVDEVPDYDTATLFAGRREIVIRHAGADYRMKITKQGKLILNK
jgi:hemin uptake protein HemP